MSDWQVGDLALCVDDRPSRKPIRWEPVAGAIYTVASVAITDGGSALELEEDPYRDGLTAWFASRFRKIRPDEHEACEPEFVKLLKRTKVPA
jgi:hypothetical protein